MENARVSSAPHPAQTQLCPQQSCPCPLPIIRRTDYLIGMDSEPNIIRAENILTDRVPQPANYILRSEFAPNGDQPLAIRELMGGLLGGERDQVLLGVTGSGKTFTIAHVIKKAKRPALILAPNKTLAAQLYGEMKACSLIMQWSISYPIMIIISLRPMCRDQIPISKKNPQSMSRLTGCAIRPLALCWSVMM